MAYTLYDFLGNLGVALILLTYFLLQTDRLNSRALSYSLMNAIGALLILLSLYHQFNLSAFIIEFFWLLISVYGLWQYKSGKKQSTP